MEGGQTVAVHSDASSQDRDIRPQWSAAAATQGILSRFLAIGATILVGLSLFSVIEWQHHRQQDRLLMTQALETLRAISEAELAEVRADLDLVVGHSALQDAPADKVALGELLRAFARSRARYARITVHDSAGGEVIRIEVPPSVERESDSPSPVLPPEILRNPARWPQPNEMAMFHAGADPGLPAPMKPPIHFAAQLANAAGGAPALLVLDVPVSALVDKFEESVAAIGTATLSVGRTRLLQHGPASGSYGAAGSPDAVMSPEDDGLARVWQAIGREGNGYIETPDGDFAFATFVYPLRRSLLGREPFLLPPGAALDGNGDAWTLVMFRSASLVPGSMGWVLALAAGLLTLAGVYAVQFNREVQQRAQASAALSASESRLHQQRAFNEMLLHGLPVPVFVKAADGRYLACNDAFAGVVGLSRAAIIGRRTEDILPPADLSLHRSMDDAALSQWREQRYEAQSPFGAGSLGHWLIVKSPFRLGGTTGIIGVGLDISDRRRAEEALQRSQQFFRRTLNTIPQPVFVKDYRHRFVFLNDAACLYFGFSREQMLGMTDHDFFPAEQADEFVALDELVFALGGSNLKEEKITDSAGSEHVILTTKAVFEDDTGHPVIVGVITDITERKRTEELLRIGAEVFEHSSEGIMITDDRAQILMVNKAFVDITGYEAVEVIGHNARTFASAPLGETFFRSVFYSLRKTGYWKGEVVSRRKNGDVYVVEMPVCAVRDDAGRVLRYIAMLTDITKRKQSEARVSYLAEHDFLTGLANRVLLHDRAERAMLQARRTGKKVAALLLDLDHFKQVNDNWGHAIGDLLLKQVAERLTAAVRQSDTVARVGGDEFVVLLPDIHGRVDAGRVALAIYSALAKPFINDNRHAHIGVSCGIAVYPDDAASVDALFRVADSAMYRAKQRRYRPPDLPVGPALNLDEDDPADQGAQQQMSASS